MSQLVEANGVVDFVFHERSLPRSVRFCLDGIRAQLVPLKHNKDALKVLDRSRRTRQVVRRTSASALRVAMVVGTW